MDSRFADDQRGLATGIIAFFAIIIAGALLFTMLAPAAQEIFTMSSDQASTTQATDAIDLRESIFMNSLYFVLLLAALTIIARAVFESRRPS